MIVKFKITKLKGPTLIQILDLLVHMAPLEPLG